MKLKYWLVVMVICISLNGCSAFQPHKENVVFDSVGESCCPSDVLGQIVRIEKEITQEGDKIMAVYTEKKRPESTYLHWRGDLNEDGFEDLVLRIKGSYGSGRQFAYSIYVGCSDEHYIEVLTAEYWHKILSVKKTDGRGWSDIYVSMLAEKKGGDIDEFIEIYRTIRFIDERYQVIKEQ